MTSPMYAQLEHIEQTILLRQKDSKSYVRRKDNTRRTTTNGSAPQPSSEPVTTHSCMSLHYSALPRNDLPWKCIKDYCPEARVLLGSRRDRQDTKTLQNVLGNSVSIHQITLAPISRLYGDEPEQVNENSREKKPYSKRDSEDELQSNKDLRDVEKMVRHIGSGRRLRYAVSVRKLIQATSGSP